MPVLTQMNQTSSPSSPTKSAGRRWLKILLEIVLVISILFAFRAWQKREIVTGAAPDFHSILLNEKAIKFEDYRGKPVLIHFWADWCPFCKIEEGGITSIQKDWPVLTIAYESGDAANVSKHMKDREIQNWPTVIDQDGRLADLYGVKGVPTSFIIDAKGNIKFVEVGLTSEWGLRARLWWANLFNSDLDKETIK